MTSRIVLLLFGILLLLHFILTLFFVVLLMLDILFIKTPLSLFFLLWCF